MKLSRQVLACVAAALLAGMWLIYPLLLRRRQSDQV